MLVTLMFQLETLEDAQRGARWIRAYLSTRNTPTAAPTVRAHLDGTAAIIIETSSQQDAIAIVTEFAS